MSRTIATIQRPDPHDFENDPAYPGCCRVCRLIEANGVHSAAAIAEHRAALAVKQARIHEAQEAHRRMTGER